MDEYLKFGGTEDAREILKSTREKLVERNTHVRIADKYGWDTLEEYVGDSLVDGPDEATKLRKAESRAIKKRKEKSEKKPYDTGGSSIRNDLFRINNGEAGRQHFTQAGNFSRALTATPQINMPRSPLAKSTVCFYCFEEGHVAPQCPLKIQVRTSLPTATITKEITDKKSA